MLRWHDTQYGKAILLDGNKTTNSKGNTMNTLHKWDSAEHLKDEAVEFFEFFLPICYVVTSVESALEAIEHGRLTQSKWI